MIVCVNLFVWYAHCKMKTFACHSFTEMSFAITLHSECYDSCLVIDSKFGFCGIGLDYGTFKTLLQEQQIGNFKTFPKNKQSFA